MRKTNKTPQNGVRRKIPFPEVIGNVENTPIILSNIHKYKSKIKGKNKGKAFVHKKAFIKMLKINVRIERLLNEKDLIKRTSIFGLNIYTIADIEQFMKNNNSIHKHG